MNISGQVGLALRLDEALAPDSLESGGTSVLSGLIQAATFAFASGTGAGQADLKFVASYTIAGGGSQTLTLSALVDGLGRAVALARVRTLILINTSQVPADVVNVGNAPTHPWDQLASDPTKTVPVKSMGMEVRVAMNTNGMPVAAGSADQLLISNPGASPITVHVVLIGASA